mgnify:CR=1 FL=1
MVEPDELEEIDETACKFVIKKYFPKRIVIFSTEASDIKESKEDKNTSRKCDIAVVSLCCPGTGGRVMSSPEIISASVGHQM